jgi:hypothetical protein
MPRTKKASPPFFREARLFRSFSTQPGLTYSDENKEKAKDENQGRRYASERKSIRWRGDLLHAITISRKNRVIARFSSLSAQTRFFGFQKGLNSIP